MTIKKTSLNSCNVSQSHDIHICQSYVQVSSLSPKPSIFNKVSTTKMFVFSPKTTHDFSYEVVIGLLIYCNTRGGRFVSVIFS